MVVAGKEEAETRTISIRGRDGNEMKGVIAGEFVDEVKQENTAGGDCHRTGQRCEGRDEYQRER